MEGLRLRRRGQAAGAGPGPTRAHQPARPPGLLPAPVGRPQQSHRLPVVAAGAGRPTRPVRGASAARRTSPGTSINVILGRVASTLEPPQHAICRFHSCSSGLLGAQAAGLPWTASGM